MTTNPDAPTPETRDAAPDANEHFERLAAVFYRQTRLMAPGKSDALATEAEDARRREAWEMWMKGRSSTVGLPVEAPRTPPAGVVDDRTYLVWSNEHKAWWRPNGRGYTSELKYAGRYTEADAKQIEHEANYRGVQCQPDELPEVAVPIADKLRELEQTRDYLLGLAPGECARCRITREAE